MGDAFVDISTQFCTVRMGAVNQFIGEWKNFAVKWLVNNINQSETENGGVTETIITRSSAIADKPRVASL